MFSVGMNANSDLYLGPDGNLVGLTGVQACEQSCKQAMATQVGSLTLNLPRGVDTLNTIWNKYQPALFSAQARALLLTVPNVTAVQSFTVTKTGNTATYEAQIMSTFGPIRIAGTLNQPAVQP